MQKYLIPREGLIVRDEFTREPLSPIGALKPWGRYWRRRVKCGDCTIGRPPTIKNKKKEIKS